jgi:hypothetical protein
MPNLLQLKTSKKNLLEKIKHFHQTYKKMKTKQLSDLHLGAEIIIRISNDLVRLSKDIGDSKIACKTIELRMHAASLESLIENHEKI